MITDWRGIEIKVGDLVVYPGRHGSLMWMVEAEVVDLIPGNPDAKSYWDRVPHGLQVRRLRESGYRGAREVAKKLVRIQANRVTVVVSVKSQVRGIAPQPNTI